MDFLDPKKRRYIFATSVELQGLANFALQVASLSPSSSSSSSSSFQKRLEHVFVADPKPTFCRQFAWSHRNFSTDIFAAEIQWFPGMKV